jgi:hypothetical protein
MTAKAKKHQPATPSKGMTPGVRKLIAKGAKDDAILAVLKPKYPSLTLRIVAEIRAKKVAV